MLVDVEQIRLPMKTLLRNSRSLNILQERGKDFITFDVIFKAHMKFTFSVIHSFSRKLSKKLANAPLAVVKYGK